MTGVGILSCIFLFVLLAVHQLLSNWCSARSSRWTALARRFPGDTSRPDRSQVVSNATVAVNGKWYSRTIELTLSAAGLGLSQPALLPRVAHRPIQIPWDDVSVQSISADEGMVLKIGQEHSLTANGPAFDALLKFHYMRYNRRYAKSGRRGLGGERGKSAG